MKKKHRDLFIFALLFLSLFYFIPSSKDQQCSLQDSFEKLSFNGVVENKFVDRSQHSIPTIVIRNFEDDRIDTLSLFFDRSETFDLISQLDTVYKISKSLDIHIKRKNKSVLISKLNFGCNELKRVNNP